MKPKVSLDKSGGGVKFLNLVAEKDNFTLI